VKVDLYGPVHVLLRRASGDALDKLARCTGDADRITAALRATRQLLMMYEVHARVEDEIVIVALHARRHGAGARLSEAHRAQHAVIGELRARIDELERWPDYLGVRALYLELSHFVADQFVHMYDEETLAQPVFEEIYTQAELAALSARCAESVSPQERAAFAAVMV